MLPQELIDEIFSKTDFQTCVKIGNEYGINKLFNPLLHTIEWACSNGEFDIVKYLVYKGYTPTPFSIDNASANGHLCIVKYLYNMGILPNDATYYLAKHNGYNEVVEFLELNDK